jgi:hypothetical protein
MIMDLCRWWNQDLRWWEALNRDEQTEYVADYRLEVEHRNRMRRLEDMRR